jgi:hypothetical protein
MSLGGANLIVGIDPGCSSGAIAILDVNDYSVQFHKMPVIEYRTPRKDKSGKWRYINCKQLNEGALLELLRTIITPQVALVVVEHQACFPGGGVVTQGKLLFAYGLLKGLLMPMPVQVVCIKPLAWKKVLHCRLGNDASPYQKKCRDHQRALDLYPELRQELSPRYKNFDKCDALLLAHYGLLYMRKRGLFKDLDIDDELVLI